jgi:hypothetical protein
VAGSWYPADAHALARDIDRYCEAVTARVGGEIAALVVPHAGLMYSGPVAAHAWSQVRGRSYDVVLLVGPSHYVGFEGMAVVTRGAFDTPFGPVAIDEDVAAAVLDATPLAHERPSAHHREHALELQLPFLRRLLEHVPIVPIVMGHQSAATVRATAEALTRAAAGRRALLVASSDLSHFHPAGEAARLDAVMVRAIGANDPDAVDAALVRFPDHACGGGPVSAVLRAARTGGATDARVLCYRDSGDVSGDKRAVVGYVAAVTGALIPDAAFRA